MYNVILQATKELTGSYNSRLAGITFSRLVKSGIEECKSCNVDCTLRTDKKKCEYVLGKGPCKQLLQLMEVDSK